MTVPNIISGNLKTSISEHFAQFLLGTNIFFNSSWPKPSNYEWDWLRFDREKFV